MSADLAVGIMDGAYFTSRTEILNFFNNLFDLNLTKIEQTASGAVACQLTEYLFPGSIPLRRVNWETKNSYEYVQNYKLLQAAFSKNRVQKYVDVDKLIRGKYQDNLEFCQWLKAFHDQQQMQGTVREEYDPVAARALGKGGKKLNNTHSRGKKPANSTSRRVLTKKTQPPSNTNPSTRNKNQLQKQKENYHSNDEPSIVADAGLIKKNADLTSRNAGLTSMNADLTSRNAELELTVAEIEKERDFYFEKLRDVEVLLQVHQERKVPSEIADFESLINGVFKVLYATTEDKVLVDDNGEFVSAKDGAVEQTYGSADGHLDLNDETMEEDQ